MTWLLSVGWRKAGLIGVAEVPGLRAWRPGALDVKRRDEPFVFVSRGCSKRQGGDCAAVRAAVMGATTTAEPRLRSLQLEVGGSLGPAACSGEYRPC